MEFLFPPDMNSLKQALALMTARQASVLTAQGPASTARVLRGPASAVETKTAKIPNVKRIVKSGRRFEMETVLLVCVDGQSFKVRSL